MDSFISQSWFAIECISCAAIFVAHAMIADVKLVGRKKRHPCSSSRQQVGSEGIIAIFIFPSKGGYKKITK